MAKNNKGSSANLCQTLMSHGSDSDEDYVDRLIRKNGSKAMDVLLKNENTSNTQIEEEEIVDFRDSIVHQSN